MSTVWNAQEAFSRLAVRLDVLETQRLKASDQTLQQAKTIVELANALAASHGELQKLTQLVQRLLPRHAVAGFAQSTIATGAVRFDNQPSLYHGPG